MRLQVSFPAQGQILAPHQASGSLALAVELEVQDQASNVFLDSHKHASLCYQLYMADGSPRPLARACTALGDGRLQLPALQGGNYSIEVELTTPWSGLLASAASFFAVQHPPGGSAAGMASPGSPDPALELTVAVELNGQPAAGVTWRPAEARLYDFVRDWCVRHVSAQYEQAAVCAWRLAQQFQRQLVEDPPRYAPLEAL